MKIWMLKSKYTYDKISNIVSAFSDTIDSNYAKSRNLWIQIIRDSDSATLDVGYDQTSKDAALVWSAGTDSYICKRYNQIRGKSDITISSASDQELIITSGAWVSHTVKYCLFEPSKSSLSVMDIPLSVNARMANKTLASYVIVKDDKPTTLLTAKGYNADYVFPIKCSTGLMDFGWTNLSNIFWYLAGGGTSTSERPGATLGAGVSYSFGTNMQDVDIQLADNNTDDKYIGNANDFPILTLLLNIDACSNMTGDIKNFRHLLYYINAYICGISGNLSDAPKCNYFMHVGGCVNVSGVYIPNPSCERIYLYGTAMSASDTDNTLIAINNTTTFLSGGILYIKSNRTSISDDAVAGLIAKNWTITEL